MSTSTYSGRLSDHAEAPFPSAFPRLWVTPERATFGPTGLLAEKRIPVAVNSLGEFTFSIVASIDTAPQTRYQLICEWLDSTATPVGYSVWEFTAALGGGPIKNMGVIPISRIWVGTTAPLFPGPGLWWLDTSAYPYLWKEWV